MRVMPSFCAMMPERMALILRSAFAWKTKRRSPIPLELDLDVDAGGQVELHQSVDRLRRRVDDVENPLVGANFELLARLLVDVRRSVHGEFLDPRRQRDRPTDPRAGALGRRDDLLRRSVEHSVIERLEADADVLRVHDLDPWPRAGEARGLARQQRRPSHSVILATTPEPTVRPPSRMAKRSFSSIAIGTISSTAIVTLSPGITISVPSGSWTMPVTSVVRK